MVLKETYKCPRHKKNISFCMENETEPCIYLEIIGKGKGLCEYNKPKGDKIV